MLIDDIDRTEWLPDRSLIYKEADGIRLPMQLFYPPGSEDRSSLPVVLCIHGGGFAGRKDNSPWSGDILAPHARYFAARGAVGAVISYRNVARPYQNREEFERGPGLFDLYSDVRSAIRHLREHADAYRIDPDRIAVLGESAGGHLAASAGTIDAYDTPGENRSVRAMADAIIALNPITDLTDEAWFPYVSPARTVWETAPAPVEEKARSISPLQHISESTVPFLLIHGLRDTVVDVRHSTVFHERMQTCGARSELILLPDAGHSFMLIGWRAMQRLIVEATQAVDAFLVSLGWLPEGDVLQVAYNRGDGELYLDGPSVINRLPAVMDPMMGPVLVFAGEPEGMLLESCNGMGGAAQVRLKFQTDSLAAEGELISRLGSYGRYHLGYSLQVDSTHGLVLDLGGHRLQPAAGGPELIEPGVWHAAEFTVRAGYAELRLNGETVAAGEVPDVVLAGNRLRLGSGFAGRICGVEVYR